MKLNNNNFANFINKNYLFENKPLIALAVSGGPDSMALAHLLNKWVEKNKGKLQFNLEAQVGQMDRLNRIKAAAMARSTLKFQQAQQQNQQEGNKQQEK